MYNTSFMKYFFLLLIFCVLFSGLYHRITETISFHFITGIQTLYLVIFVFQLIQDSNIGFRALTIDIPKTKYTPEDKIYIPLAWVILPVLILQLISSVFMTTMSNYMKKKYGHIKLTRNKQWNLNIYKTMFILATFTIMFLTYSYCVDFTPIIPLSGMYKSWLLLMLLVSILFPIANVANANHLCSTISKTTQ